MLSYLNHASIQSLPATGGPAFLSSEWSDVKHSMLEIAASERANPLAAMVAATLLSSLHASGAPAPTSALDPDGDIILTWHQGSRKGSAVITEDKMSAVITSGARIEYVSPEIDVVAQGRHELEAFSKGVGKWMQHSKGLSLSSTATGSAAIFSHLTWLQPFAQTSKAFLTTRTLSSSSRETESEWSLSSGTGTLSRLKR